MRFRVLTVLKALAPCRVWSQCWFSLMHCSFIKGSGIRVSPQGRCLKRTEPNVMKILPAATSDPRGEPRPRAVCQRAGAGAFVGGRSPALDREIRPGAGAYVVGLVPSGAPAFRWPGPRLLEALPPIPQSPRLSPPSPPLGRVTLPGCLSL